jgi:hypothetical protein
MPADPNHPALALTIAPDVLRPLVEQVVAAALAQLEAAKQTVAADDRLCYSEAEAAQLLGVEPHVLRDERLRKNIKASSIVGRRIRYTRADLVTYLAGRPWTSKEA